MGRRHSTNWRSMAQTPPPCANHSHHHSENRKRRNVLLVFADNTRRNIARPSTVQHLTSIHPAVIHLNFYCINLLTPRNHHSDPPLLYQDSGYSYVWRTIIFRYPISGPDVWLLTDARENCAQGLNMQ